MSLSISVAGDDAADTAIKYGKYCAVVYPAVGTIVRVVKCKGYGVDINPNFSEKQKQKLTLTLPQEFSHSDLSVLPLSTESRELNFLQKLKMIDINIVEKENGYGTSYRQFNGYHNGKIKEMIDVNTIIGEPITSPDGTLIIPVSKVSYGFAAGGSDLPTKRKTKTALAAAAVQV